MQISKKSQTLLFAFAWFSRWFCLGLGCVLAAGLTVASAAEAGTNAPGGDLKIELTKLQKKEIEAVAKFNLLKEWAAQHRQRSEEADRTNQTAKAKWELELSRELADRAEQAAVQLEAAMRQRAAAEQAAKESLPAAASEPTDQDEVAFFTRLDTQLWKVEQEINATLESTRGYAEQLRTNNTPDEVFRVSVHVQENNTLLRFLERERSDLELKKLQYRALKKR